MIENSKLSIWIPAFAGIQGFKNVHQSFFLISLIPGLTGHEEKRFQVFLPYYNSTTRNADCFIASLLAKRGGGAVIPENLLDFGT